MSPQRQAIFTASDTEEVEKMNKKALASLCILSGELTGTKISAENLFSLPICVIMGLTKSLPCVKGGGSRRLTEGL